MARLFFALWPEAKAARALELLAERLAAQSGGKRAPRDKIHLTLVFVGEVPLDREAALREAAARVRGEPFDAVLDRSGCFRRARVAWVGIGDPAPQLIGLQAALSGELRAAGFTLEERPYSPHVTLARRTSRAIPEEPIEPIRWSARDFALVRSETGTGRYTTVEKWALR